MENIENKKHEIDIDIQVKPMITAIVQTYRRPQLLRRTINSLLNQTYTNLQICVYDNASGDETSKVVAEFAQKDPRVKYHCHSVNIGGLKNFHYAIARVDTPYFHIIADDDWALPEFYKLGIAALQTHKEAKFFAGLTINVDNDLSPLMAIPSEDFPEGVNSPPEGMYKMISGHIPWTSMIFNATLIKELGISDCNSVTLDYDFEVLAAGKYPFVVSHQPCAIYHVHSANGAKTISAEDFHSGVLHLAGKLLSDDTLPYPTQRGIWRAMEKQQFRLVCSKAYYNFMTQQIPEAIKSVEILASIKKITLKTIFFQSFCVIGNIIPGFFAFVSAVLRTRFNYLEKQGKVQAKRKYGQIIDDLRPYFNAIS